MKLFLSYSYQAESVWVEKLVIPLIQTFEVEVVTGKDMHGQVITEEVRKRIGSSNALIAIFTTDWKKHPWVRDEYATALGSNIPAVEIKEKNLPSLNGMGQGMQRIEFNTIEKEPLLLEIAKLVAKWVKIFERRRLIILPDEVLAHAMPHIEPGNVKCFYKFMHGFDETQVFETKPIHMNEALAVDIKNIPSPEALIQLSIKGPGFSWSCGYQAFGLTPIQLQNY